MKSLNCNNNSLTAVVNVNKCVHFQLDSGAQTNTIRKKYVREEQGRQLSSTLRVYGSASLKTLGEVGLCVTNLKSNEEMYVTFTFVSNKLQGFFRTWCSIEMNLIKVNGEKFISKLNAQSKLDLGEATLVVDSKI